MKDEKPPHDDEVDRLTAEADAAHEAALRRLQGDVHFADRFDALEKAQADQADPFYYSVHRRKTGRAERAEAKPERGERGHTKEMSVVSSAPEKVLPFVAPPSVEPSAPESAPSIDSTESGEPTTPEPTLVDQRLDLAPASLAEEPRPKDRWKLGLALVVAALILIAIMVVVSRGDTPSSTAASAQPTGASSEVSAPEASQVLPTATTASTSPSTPPDVNHIAPSARPTGSVKKPGSKSAGSSTPGPKPVSGGDIVF